MANNSIVGVIDNSDKKKLVERIAKHFGDGDITNSEVQKRLEEGMTFGDIGLVCGCSGANVRVIYDNAMKKIQKKLGGLNFDDLVNDFI